MIHSRLLASCVAASLAVAASAQIGPLHFVNAAGAPLPLVNGYPSSSDGEVFLAFDSLIVTDFYYVHVTDPAISEVLSANDEMERIVYVENNGGVISLSFLGGYSNPAAFGVAADGVSQTLRLTPVDSAANNPCHFKAWVGDTWLLPDWLPDSYEWPYIVRPEGQQAFGFFGIGDGTGSDVTGEVFVDANQNQVRDLGEGPAIGWEVQLTANGSTVSTLTDANGQFSFPDVGAGSYSLNLVVQAGYQVTVGSNQSFDTNGCSDAPSASFGVAPLTNTGACDGHTIGFWRNGHGLGIITQLGILGSVELQQLNLRDAAGNHFVPTTTSQVKTFLKQANAVNMAYMLSAQLFAMHCNVENGFVDGSCMVLDPYLGMISIDSLMEMAKASLMANGLTLAGHPQREVQEIIKNALDNANNNLNWL